MFHPYDIKDYNLKIKLMNDGIYPNTTVFHIYYVFFCSLVYSQMSLNDKMIVNKGNRGIHKS